MGSKRKQLILTALFLVLTCVFTGAGVWFRAHPLFTEEGATWKDSLTMPENTYEPYLTAIVSSSNATATVPPIAATQLSPLTVFPEEPADAMVRFYTIERASVFTFSGIRNEQELRSVLEALERTGSHATFFVTAEEMDSFPEQIREICNAGHHLGIGVPLMENDTAETLLGYIQDQAKTLRLNYGVDYEIFIRSIYDKDNYALRQASEAAGFRLLSEMKEAVPESLSRAADTEEVLSAIFYDYEGMLQRGEIIHFQMGRFLHSDTLLGELVERMLDERCIYPIRSADEVAENQQMQYVYPVPMDMILTEVKDQIHPGHLDGMTPDQIFEVIRSGYIGNQWISPPDYFPGFSLREAWQLDMTGLINNKENYVFLTFDDWGTDENVDKILAVLEKHGATATFFVRSNYVHSNPNLLRAIAAAGHTIGAHTYSHLTLSNEVSPDHFEELTEEERETLEEDIILCYDSMQTIIGDMVDADGKPSLSRLFRPPTLAVGRNGLETVFDCGYTHVILGSHSSQDYVATDVDSLYYDLRYYTGSGTIIIMHFSDNSVYTAEALDQLFTRYERFGTGYKFVGLNKVLG